MESINSEESNADISKSKESLSPNIDYDKLLSKYVAVWIWSIMVGTVSAFIYTSIGSSIKGFSEKWVALLLLSLITNLIKFTALLFAYIELYKCLKVYLLPEFFLEHKGDSVAFAHYIRSAFITMLIALTVSIASSVSETIISVLQF